MPLAEKEILDFLKNEPDLQADNATTTKIHLDLLFEQDADFDPVELVGALAKLYDISTDNDILAHGHYQFRVHANKKHKKGKQWDKS